jgi:hypothetical protein
MKSIRVDWDGENFALRMGSTALKIDEVNDEAWICTPDIQRVAKLRSRLNDPGKGSYAARFTDGDDRTLVKRFGPGRAEWSRDDA